MHIFHRRWLTWWLLPLAAAFRGVVALRNFLYDHRLRSGLKLDVPVISVGNLTVGGTGKTPAVEYVARWLQEQHRRPAIVTRGYGREVRGTVVVADGHRICAEVVAGGDEALQLARRLPGTVVIADERKHRGALHAATHFGVDAIIIDDGFQHRQLQRDFDVVLIDAAVFHANRWMLPAGPFREPLTTLRRADAVLLTRVDKSAPQGLAKLEALCARYQGKIPGRAVIKAAFFENLLTGARQPLESMRGTRVAAVCGIAQPARFFESLTQHGADLVARRALADHHPFAADEIRELLALAAARNAAAVVITEKDATKWRSHVEGAQLPVLVLRVEFCPLPPLAWLEGELRRRISADRPGGGAIAVHAQAPT